ncbi:MAG: hypothetical protein LUQ50_15235 [Methanospirillum sp.]|uniref:hypothetical protein n=1 Tax=Methanospirillum sp. TaxID=45200 RepID=UPI00237336D6|nr:hypothetical protein [Methanospirillum sp.]MDD1730407.1 hypothetical protein [Methanospirillum sp.]
MKPLSFIGEKIQPSAMDRIAKFLILLVAALVLVPGCFAEENTTASETVDAVIVDAVNNTTEIVDVVANLTEDVLANNTTVDDAMNVTNVSPLAANASAI